MRPLEGVRGLRERRMLSQQELADRAGVSLFTVQRIERGDGSVRPKTGRAIAAALGVGVEDLLGKDQAPLPFEETTVTELPGLRSARERRGISINELAARAGMTSHEISYLEASRGVTDSNTVGRLAEGLGCFKAELMFPREVFVAFEAEDREQNERIREELATLSETDIRALMIASPTLRKLSEAYRKGAEQHAREQAKAG